MVGGFQIICVILERFLVVEVFGYEEYVVMFSVLFSFCFDYFYCYDELIVLLFVYVEVCFNFVLVCFIGKSYEGCDIWVVVVMNLVSGMDIDKLVMWIDGNIYVVELIVLMICLYYLYQLFGLYGGSLVEVQQVMWLFDMCIFYIVLCLNFDGVELVLVDWLCYICSFIWFYFYIEEFVDGLIVEDIDGDGCILMMCVFDFYGGYKKYVVDL